MKRAWLGAAAVAALIAAPVRADNRVKAGVDAWARGDYAAAVELWRGPADAGDSDAEFNLGQAYKLGRGVPADLNQAEKWYRLAAQQNHPQAQDNFGLALFQNGKHADAVQWLQRSAQRGEPRAQFVLGTMYFNGDAVPKDWARAYAWILRAAASGLPQAMQTQQQMDRYVPLADRQEGQALAERYEAEANQPQAPVGVASNGRAPAPPNASLGTAELAPSSAYRAPATDDTPAPIEAPIESASVQTPARKPTRTPVAASARGWQLQLGAFGDAGNARKLWVRIRTHFPGRAPAYVKAGGLTKVLVGRYASKADAARGCAAIRPCVPIAP